MKKARAKAMSKPLASALAAHGKAVGSPLEQSYRNSVYCAELITQTGCELTTEYCGNRWCLVCNRIRTGKAIKRYAAVLEGWRDAWFVTLTVPNVAGPALGGMMRTMGRALKEIRRRLRRASVAVKMLRKLECTYNAARDDYHPHFHIVIEGERAGRAVLREWLATFPLAVRRAQDCRRCAAGSLAELFKYFTKLTAKHRGQDRQWIPMTALDTIFRAMRGCRVYQPCGFRGAPDIDEETVETTTTTRSPWPASPNGSIGWRWQQNGKDWIDYETGALLSGFECSPRFATFVDRLEGAGHVRAPDDDPVRSISLDLEAPA